MATFNTLPPQEQEGQLLRERAGLLPASYVSASSTHGRSASHPPLAADDGPSSWVSASQVGDQSVPSS